MMKTSSAGTNFPNATQGLQTPPQGGFLTSPGARGTPTPSNYNRQGDFMRNIVPITVAQIWKAGDDDEIKVGNSLARILSLVGKVKCVSKSSATLTFTVDDMTGAPIEAKLWLGFDEKVPDELASLSSFPYAHVIGTLRSFQKKRFLHASKILPIHDANEITMHLLEVIHSSMSITVKEQMDYAASDEIDTFQWHPPGDTTATVLQGSSAATCTYQSMFLNSSNFSTSSVAVTPPKTCQPITAMLPQSSVAKPLSAAVKGLNMEQIMVLKVISSCKSPIGIGYDQLFSSLKSLNKHVILQAVDFLNNEGHIYNTIDDEHFLATDDELVFT